MLGLGGILQELERGAVRVVAAALLTAALLIPASAGEPLVGHFLDMAAPGDLVPGADAYGPVSPDATVPAMKNGKPIGWVFLTSDFVSTTGYSGKPIHILAGVSPDAVITGVRLVKHAEPIVLVGIPRRRSRPSRRNTPASISRRRRPRTAAATTSRSSPARPSPSW